MLIKTLCIKVDLVMNLKHLSLQCCPVTLNVVSLNDCLLQEKTIGESGTTTGNWTRLHSLEILIYLLSFLFPLVL